MWKPLHAGQLDCIHKGIIYGQCWNFIALNFENDLSKFIESLRIVLLKGNSMRFPSIAFDACLTQGKENDKDAGLNAEQDLREKPEAEYYTDGLQPC